jgi:hypothetical protein
MLGYCLSDKVIALPLYLERRFGLCPIGTLLENTRADDLNINPHPIHFLEPDIHVGHPIERWFRNTNAFATWLALGNRESEL